MDMFGKCWEGLLLLCWHYLDNDTDLAPANFGSFPRKHDQEWSKGGRPPVDLGFNFNSPSAALDIHDVHPSSHWYSSHFQMIQTLQKKCVNMSKSVVRFTVLYFSS